MARTQSTDWVNISGFYSQYGNANGDSSKFPHQAPSADIELGIRVFHVISLVGSITNTVQPDRDDANIAQYRIRQSGGGLKFDLPGFFFIGGELKDFKRWGKIKPFNTFLLTEALSLGLVDLTTEQTSTVQAGRFSLGMDIFPWTELSHFTLRASYLNHSNIGYWVYSFGGGVLF